jgi:hypothetical protein
MDWRELLHHLNRLRVPSMDNSTHQYDGYLLRRMRAHNVSWPNGSWADMLPANYDLNATGDAVPDECFPFLGLLDFFQLYYMPTIILTGMSRFKTLFRARLV